MDQKLIAILATGVLVMGVTAWWVAIPPRPPELPESQRRFMHCTQCGREVRYDARYATQDCPYCGEKGPQVVTRESVRRTGLPPGAVMRIIPALLIELTVLAAIVYWHASRRVRQAEGEEPTYPLFCSQCHRKLRFRRSQAGRLGKCPSCRRLIVFPKVPEPIHRTWPARVWQKVMGSERRAHQTE